jgi:diphthamide biosynthesis methyltransferase
MKLTVDIDEKEIQESAIDLITKNTVSDMESMLFDDSRYSHLRKIYKDTVQQLMRDIIKKHEAEIVDKAIEQAAGIVARKAWTIKAGDIV